MSPLHGYRVRGENDVQGQGETRSYGTCLYLGPRGQRCDRPAREDGFCRVHSPDAEPVGPWTWFRRGAALLVAAAILWPIIEAFIEELSHWRH
jgi:hypothetical protein